MRCISVQQLVRFSTFFTGLIFTIQRKKLNAVSVQQAHIVCLLILSIPFIHSSEPKEPHKVLIKKQGVTSNHSPFALIVSEFRHPEPMQIAVCVNGHRFFTAQFKNSAGSLPRIQIADIEKYACRCWYGGHTSCRRNRHNKASL